MRSNDGSRTGGEVLVDQLIAHGVGHVFCVPGESYLAALDAFYDRDIAVTVCRQEGGAAMMAEAVGKLTGRPGICFTTRGPGASNASLGIHIARQDDLPSSSLDAVHSSSRVCVNSIRPAVRRIAPRLKNAS